MELIKKIKQTEAEARKIIEQAKTQAAELAEQSRENRRLALEKAELAREKNIEATVSGAESEGLAEIEQLKAHAEKNRQQLRDKTADKIAAAAAKVMDYLGSGSVKKQQEEGPLEG